MATVHATVDATVVERLLNSSLKVAGDSGIGGPVRQRGDHVGAEAVGHVELLTIQGLSSTETCGRRESQLARRTRADGRHVGTRADGRDVAARAAAHATIKFVDLGRDAATVRRRADGRKHGAASLHKADLGGGVGVVQLRLISRVSQKSKTGTYSSLDHIVAVRVANQPLKLTRVKDLFDQRTLALGVGDTNALISLADEERSVD